MKFNKITTLICPGLGTGVGRMTFKECAKQVLEAIVDHEAGVEMKDELPNECDMVLHNLNDEQPELFENTEIKTIKIDDNKAP